MSHHEKSQSWIQWFSHSHSLNKNAITVRQNDGRDSKFKFYYYLLTFPTVHCGQHETYFEYFDQPTSLKGLNVFWILHDTSLEIIHHYRFWTPGRIFYMKRKRDLNISSTIWNFFASRWNTKSCTFPFYIEIRNYSLGLCWFDLRFNSHLQIQIQSQFFWLRLCQSLGSRCIWSNHRFRGRN